MFSFLIVVALILAGQVGGASERYAQRTTGAATSTSPSGSNGSVIVAPAVSSQTPPATNGSSRNSSTAPGTGGSYPTSPPPGFGNQRTSPLGETSGGSAATGQGQSPPAGYPTQP